MFSWFKRIIRKIGIFILDILAIMILAGLGLFCLGLLKVLYLTHMGQVILSIVGFIILTIWACYRVFTKRNNNV